ncbi:hypothetical protein V1284_007385 [Nitrobacteraceae bacterium AZCC 2299]
MVSRFSAGRRKLDLVEFANQVVEERLHLVLRGALGALRHREGQSVLGRQLEPLVADQQHRLGEVQRGEAGIDREGDDAIGQRHLFVEQAVALAAEQDGDGAAGGDLPGNFLRGGFRRDHRLGLVMGTGGGGEQQRTVGHCLLDGVEQFDLVEDVIGTGGGAAGMDVGPAVARIDDAQPGQPEITHGARGHADVLAELRLDQNDDRAVELAGGLGVVGA